MVTISRAEGSGVIARRTGKGGFFLLFVLTMECWVFVGERPAMGQSESPSQVVEASSHHDRGINFFRQGDFSEAIEEFQRAEELSHEPINLWNIARCQERLGQRDRAIEYLERFMAEPNVPAERRQQALELLQQLREHPPLIVETTEPGDGEEFESSHESEGQIDDSSAVTSEPSLLGPWLVLGAGLAIALTGGILDIAAYARFSRTETEQLTIEEFLSWQNRVDGLALGGDILVAVGAAAALGGLIWLLLSRRGPGHPSTEASDAHLSVSTLMDGAIATLQGRF